MSPLPGTTLTDTVTIAWQASDADGDMLRAYVRFSDNSGESWKPLGHAIVGNNIEYSTLALPSSSNASLEITVSDGMNTTRTLVGNLVVGPNRAPRVRIEHPFEGDTFRHGENVVLLGSAYDLEDGKLTDSSLSWSADDSVDLGQGVAVNVADLPVGTHVISFEASDALSASATESITITVTSWPLP